MINLTAQETEANLTERGNLVAEIAFVSGLSCSEVCERAWCRQTSGDKLSVDVLREMLVEAQNAADARDDEAYANRSRADEMANRADGMIDAR